MSKLLASIKPTHLQFIGRQQQTQVRCVHQHLNRLFSAKKNRISVRQVQEHQYYLSKSHFSQSSHHHHGSEPIVLVNEDKVTAVRWVTLNNPKKRNALSLSMIEQLNQHLRDPEGKLRAIVINANGGKVFSSGHDLKELFRYLGGHALAASSCCRFDRTRASFVLATLSPSESSNLFQRCSDMMLSIRNSAVPVICQVDGLAAAAGCQLVASCDIVLATERSSFSTPGADVGLFCSTPGIAVSRSANLKMAAYMVLTGRTISAQEALASGLITRVVNEAQLESETEAILESILSKSRSVIALGKNFFYKQIELDLPTAYSQGGCTMVDNLKLKDGKEGIDSFIHKRKANWSHKNE